MVQTVAQKASVANQLAIQKAKNQAVGVAITAANNAVGGNNQSPVIPTLGQVSPPAGARVPMLPTNGLYQRSISPTGQPGQPAPVPGNRFSIPAPGRIRRTVLAPAPALAPIAFGAKAQQQISLNPGYLAKRNTQIIADYAKAGNMTADNVRTNLMTNIDFANANPNDQQATIDTIYNGVNKQVQDNQQKTIDNNFVRDQSLIDNAVQPKLFDDLLRTRQQNVAQVTEFKNDFANFDQIDGEYGMVTDSLRDILAQKQATGTVGDGMVTQQDIQDIRNRTGLSTDKINKYLGDNPFSDLKKTDEAQANDPTQRNIDQAKIDKQRALEDLDTRHEQAKQNVNNQIQDIQMQAQRNIAASEKVGALKGFNNVSAYVDGIATMKQDADRMVSRLQEQLRASENADVTSRDRMLQDFERGIQQATYDMGQQMKNIQQVTALKVSSVQENNRWGSPAMALAIAGVREKVANASNGAYQNYLSSSNAVIKNANDALDLTYKQETQGLMKLKDIQSIVYANDGQALLNISGNDVVDLVKTYGLSPEEAKQWSAAAVSKAVNSFVGLSLDDQTRVSQMFNSGQTGAQIVQTLASEGNRLASQKEAPSARYDLKSIDGVDEFGNPTKTTVLFDPATGKTKPLNGGGTGGGGATPAQTVAPVAEEKVVQTLNNFSQTKPVGSVGGQCGTFVNDYIQGMGLPRIFTDPISDKAAYSNSTTASVGSVAIMDSPSFPQYGHVAIVQSIDVKNGTMTVLQSNGANNDEKVFISKNIPISSAKYGFFDPKVGAAVNNNVANKEDSKPKLSSLASAAYDSKSLPYTGKAKEAVIEELERKGVFDKGNGNLNFYNATDAVKGLIPATADTYIDRQKAYKAYKSLDNAGNLDQYVGKIDDWRAKIGINSGTIKDTDVIELRRVLGKTLSAYANKISGAAVSDQEFARLSEQIPNTNQSETQFKNYMESYNEAMNNAMAVVKTRYGFKDTDAALRAFYGDKSTPAANNTTPDTNTVKGRRSR